jgi:hypothetical protein
LKPLPLQIRMLVRLAEFDSANVISASTDPKQTPFTQARSCDLKQDPAAEQPRQQERSIQMRLHAEDGDNFAIRVDDSRKNDREPS